MATERSQLSVRLDVDDKEFFAQATEQCGLEPSVAARQLLELIVQRMRAGGDYLDAVHELKTLWQLPRKPIVQATAPRVTSSGPKRGP